MKLSVVTTLFRSSPHIREFHRRAGNAARQLVGDDYEIIFVNDGSPDDSLELALDISHADPHVLVVDLSRNFGHHKAIMTGLEHTQGDLVFLIDSDLEEEPEYLLEFQKRMDTASVDVVYGVQILRKGDWFERLSGSLFYKLFDAVTGTALPRNVVTARLMTRRYVNALLMHREREIFLAGLWSITGFEQIAAPIKKHDQSESTYTLRKKMSILVNSITSFSNAPLVWIFYIGTIISLISLAYIIYVVFNRLFLAVPADGWTSLIASVWLLGGMIISFIGVLGIYLSKIFSETKQRPYTIVRQVYGRR
nr:glycosyltransferase [Rhizobium sp. Q54]